MREAAPSPSAAPITGAIFDCDGTLVDSMGMWNSLVEEVFDAHGIPKTPELLAEAETYNFDDMCFWFHERFGIGESGEELLAELRSTVQGHYLHDIRAFEGCVGFLDELRDAGVRMLILSATTEPEVRVALAAHGLEGYFERVIQTSETGSDKEHPEAYRYALAALGTPKESTWVFEDAPFALRSAKNFGLRTVCLYNDHDGRDLDFCTRHSDILAHGYAELSLALLADYAAPEGPAHGTLDALVVDGSPVQSSASLVRRLADESGYVIAVDRGLGACRAAGVVPDLLCGDGDSAGEELSAWAREVVANEIRYPTEKYTTDLSLAIACARHEAARRGAALALTLTCATGGRPDHALAVMGRLADAADARPRLVEDGLECRLLSPEGAARWELGASGAAVGATFSAIPLTEVAVLSEEGMRWNLDRRELPLLSDEGISNMVIDEAACVTCHEGVLACFLLHP